MRRYVAGRTDVTEKAREQYAWAVSHIEAGLGAVSIARLDRDDVAAWIEGLAAGGQLGRRSIQICRNVLRATLAEAVDEGLITRSPAARVGLPRVVAKPVIEKAAVVWDEQQVDRFLEVAGTHRWAVAFRPGVLFGLRRSEVLALRWDDVDHAAKTLRIDESLVALNNGAAWGDGKNERSRRIIPIDDETLRALSKRRADQAAERLAAGPDWDDTDLIITTRHGGLVLPRSYDRSLSSSATQASRTPNRSSQLLTVCRHPRARRMLLESAVVRDPRRAAWAATEPAIDIPRPAIERRYQVSGVGGRSMPPACLGRDARIR